MTDLAIKRPELVRVLALFPERSVAVRELFLSNESFLGLCEDYALACETLVRFEALPDADQRPEVPDYRSVIFELEEELAAMLSDPHQR
jgi:hypothetical protein